MTRQNLPRGRYLIRDADWWHLYDRPGYMLDSAQDGDAEALDRVLATVTRLIEAG